MSSNTPNLGLLKKDPTTERNDTFNIKTMMNDNWDKIDQAVGEIREEVQDIVIPDASLTVKGITKLNSAVNSTSETEAATPKAVKSVNDSLTTHMAEQAADYVRSPAYGPAKGAVNAYTFDAMPATALVDGMSVYLDNVIAANTGASTFNWSGLGAKAIVDAKGVALTAGKIPLNVIVGLRYNASASAFQLLGEGGETLTGDAIAANVLANKTFYSISPTTKLIGTMADLAATNIQSSFTADITIPAGYRNGSGKVLQPLVQAGDSPCYTDDRGSTSPNATYAKHRDVIVSKVGTYRVSFKLQVSNTMYTVYGRVYKNGSPFGIERINSTTNTLTYTEDLYFEAGDHVQLYAKMLSGSTGGTVYGFNITITNGNPTATYFN